MSRQDKLPVLTLIPPASRPRSAPRPAAPDDLARALAALRTAEAAVRAPREKDTTPSADPAPAADSFSPVGLPHPVWRAGRNGAPRGSGRAGVAASRAVAPPGDSGTSGDHAPRDRRIVAIHLPDFAMERWLNWARHQQEAVPDDLPVALAVEGPHGPVVHAINRAAGLAGVHPGARVVDMRALCPDLRVEFADIGGDRAALARLMLWARRWCPWTAVDGAAGLVMDTTGSDHLWGGEAAMLREVEAGFSLLGYGTQLAVAPTHGAAWALARCGPVRGICLSEALAETLAPLPARALRLDGDTLLLLKRLGLKTVGDLAAVPRISLARRFSREALPRNPLLRLDQAMGRLAEPLDAPDDPPRFAVQARLAEPVQDPVPHLPGLCAELCTGLAAAGFGARRVTVTVYRTDGEVRHVTVACAQASRDPAHLLRLFDGKLDGLDPGFGFDLITLGASVAEELALAQTRLDGAPADSAALARLVDRLSARLGAGAVRCPEARPGHIPERGLGWRPAMAGPPAPLEGAAVTRPARLLQPPEEVRVVYAVPEGPPAQFIWRRVTHRITRFAGPERIAPEWWRDSPGTRLRDYYRIEDHCGRRFWLYRDGVLGDGRGETPRWFVHGICA